MFLTQAELLELTGYKIAAKQIEWLRRNAVPHYVNAFGRPVVPRNLMSISSLARPEMGDVK